MLHILIIVMLAAIATHDAIAKEGGTLSWYYDGLAGWWTPVVVAGPMLVLAALAWLVCGAAGRMLDVGRGEAMDAAERVCSTARIGAVCLHAANVLVFGWIDSIRAVIGDVIVLDELIAILPALLVFCATWAAQWPLEKRVRDSVSKRELDTGRPTYPMPTRGQFVVGNLRHQVLLSLVPFTMLMAWAECAERIADWLSSRSAAATGLLAWLGSVARDPSSRSSGLLAAQFIGVAVVLSFAPLALRFVWDTVRLSPGPLRERLEGMCRQHAVGVRELLVWRTHGAMINGAVMGLWGRLRYILLTDALLDSLMRHQVEAVMAHELGHVRHRHMPWLAGVMLASLLGLSLVGTLVLWGWALYAMPRMGEAPTLLAGLYAIGSLGLELAIGIGLLVGTLSIVLYVSRRFEWQADAFAAMHLSTPGALQGELGPGAEVPADSPRIISAAGVAAMTGALAAVSELNHVPMERGSLRHGSLGLRIRKLHKLVGVPFESVPIDRTVRRIKIATAIAGFVVLVLMAAAMWWGL